MKRYFIFSLGFLLLCMSCATVEKSTVEVIPNKQPQVSKVLTDSAQERTLKRKVAIARFSNETKYGQSIFLDKNQDPIGKQAMDILSTKLASTGKFLLLDRADIDKVNKELEMADFSKLNVAADYLIVGSISEFGRETTGKVGIFSRTKKQTAYAKVNIRLIDVSTGQIIYSEEGQGEAFSEAGNMMGVGARADYDSTLNDKAVSAAISKLVSNVVENLLDKPWRAYILSYEDGSYTISGGKSQGIQVGDVFGVYKKGKRVKNPQTNMFIDLPGQLIGKLKVTTVLSGNDPANEISLCSKVNGDIPVNNFAELYIQESE